MPYRVCGYFRIGEEETQWGGWVVAGLRQGLIPPPEMTFLARRGLRLGVPGVSPGIAKNKHRF